MGLIVVQGFSKVFVYWCETKRGKIRTTYFYLLTVQR